MANTPAMPPPGYPPAGGLFDGREPAAVGIAPAAPQQRVTVFFRYLMAIPHFFVLAFIGIGASVVAFIGWFGALFTGRLPQFAADFLAGVLRWQGRVSAYQLLLTDQYPPFSFDDLDYPVRVAVRPGRLNRAAVFFRVVLIIPALLLVALLTYGTALAGLVIWLIVLISGRMPESLHQAVSAITRYQLRFIAYYWMLTSEYPGGLYGDQPGAADFGAGGAGAGGFGPGGFGAGPGFAAGYGQAPGVPPAPGMPPAPGYGAAPGYVPPAPEYGAPGAPAGYGPPPGYGAPPGDGPPPGYGPPAGYSPATPGNWTVPGPPPWRLVLSQGAKRLVTMFIVLGVIAIALISVIVGVAQKSVVNRQVALDQTHAGFAQLSTEFSSFSAAASRCNAATDPVSCVRPAARRVQAAFTRVAASEQAIKMPTPGSRQSSAALIRDLNQGAALFGAMANAAELQEYQASSSKAPALLQRLQSDYNTLISDLVNDK